jgi:hypothetical protein
MGDDKKCDRERGEGGTGSVMGSTEPDAYILLMWRWNRIPEKVRRIIDDRSVDRLAKSGCTKRSGLDNGGKGDERWNKGDKGKRESLKGMDWVD